MPKPTTPTDPPPFADQFRTLVDRICERDGTNRRDLAHDLGVHHTTITSSVYKGGVSFGLLERIAKRAQATPQELADLEMAWVKLRYNRIGVGEDKFARSVELLTLSIETIVDIEGWIDAQGLSAEYRKWMRGRDRFVKRSKEALKRIETETQSR